MMDFIALSTVTSLMKLRVEMLEMMQNSLKMRLSWPGAILKQKWFLVYLVKTA